MDIKARIAGMVTSVQVKEGDAVKVRDILGVLEAMKMEQPIAAPKEGTVKEVLVSKGDKVKTGQTMFVIE